MFLVISYEPVELQRCTLPFRKAFFIIYNFANQQKAVKPFFIPDIVQNSSPVFFAPVSNTSLERAFETLPVVLFSLCILYLLQNCFGLYFKTLLVS